MVMETNLVLSIAMIMDTNLFSLSLSPLFMLLSILRVNGNLTPGYHQYIALPLSLAFMLLSILQVNGNLTPGYHQYIVLPLSLAFMLLSILRVNGNLTPGYHQYIVLPLSIAFMLLSILRVNGNLTPGYHQYIVLPSLYLSSDDHCMAALWDTVTKGTAKVNTLITLLQADIHSPRNCLFSYREFYVLSFRTVGMKLDGNCFPY